MIVGARYPRVAPSSQPLGWYDVIPLGFSGVSFTAAGRPGFRGGRVIENLNAGGGAKIIPVADGLGVAHKSLPFG
jgi:hypothetical protein